MSKRPHRETFADIVRDVEQHPVAVEEETGPDLSSGRAKSPDGRIWRRSMEKISASRALDLARAGALVAYDPCGCGGYCGIDWFTPDDVTKLVASGEPFVKNNKRRTGRLSEWRTDDGQHMVLAEDSVRWGDLMGC